MTVRLGSTWVGYYEIRQYHFCNVKDQSTKKMFPNNSMDKKYNVHLHSADAPHHDGMYSTWSHFSLSRGTRGLLPMVHSMLSKLQLCQFQAHVTSIKCNYSWHIHTLKKLPNHCISKCCHTTFTMLLHDKHRKINALQCAHYCFPWMTYSNILYTTYICNSTLS